MEQKENLPNSLRKIAKNSGITIALTTHNPISVNVKHLDEVRLIIQQSDGSSVIVNNFDEASRGGHDTIEPLVAALTVGRNYMRSEDSKTVFVEGSTDYFYLNSMYEVLRSEEGNIFKKRRYSFCTNKWAGKA